MTQDERRFKTDRYVSDEDDGIEDARRGRTTTDDKRPGAEGRGTNFGAVEVAQDQVGDEGASNYKSSPKLTREVDHNDGHEREDDARGQGAQTYETGEAASASMEDQPGD